VAGDGYEQDTVVAPISRSARVSGQCARDNKRLLVTGLNRSLPSHQPSWGRRRPLSIVVLSRSCLRARPSSHRVASSATSMKSICISGFGNHSPVYRHRVEHDRSHYAHRRVTKQSQGAGLRSCKDQCRTWKSSTTAAEQKTSPSQESGSGAGQGRARRQAEHFR